MSSSNFDTSKSEAFSDKLVDILNHGALALMTSVGHRTGLFDTMDGMPPSTSAQIAEKADLNERYVREWLGAMTVGGVVDCDADGPRYSLPAEHASWLTRKSATSSSASRTVGACRTRNTIASTR
jgi:hypothetical protein